MQRFAQALHGQLSTHNLGDQHSAVVGFLDENCLLPGHDLYSFGSALLSSSVIVPLISPEVLSKMMTHDANQVDNVLLEWVLALESFATNNTPVLPDKLRRLLFSLRLVR